MRNVMLPGNPQAVPVVNVDTDGPEDEPGEEMAKEARVWKTYVRETDRWDKELIDGRNNSLDVMLIFAALFSAISTAFITGSLGDLKPDPAESSAQTLLVMSQTLAAMANGQPVPLAAQNNSDTTTFSPSRSAVTVNVLWLLSLSLSVAVSLVAMLAKEWCYKFMSGRSGQIYDQARRRQQKWDGIERWKMQEMLAWLPGAMHLALLLFAAGLCVYLWDINISVAVPVIVMTASTTCVYTLATIMPWIDRFCPYSTPATVIKAALPTLLALLKRVHYLAYWGADSLYKMVDNPKWLESALKHMRNWLKPESTSRDSDHSTTENTKVPMDAVTTHMLGWLIENCEDQRSVDTALQAFAGAYEGLPVASLGRVPFDLAMSRLATCVKPDAKSKALSAEELSQLSVALRYSCACITIVPHRLQGQEVDRWPDLYNEIEVRVFYSLIPVIYSYINFLNLACQQPSDSGTLSITATSAAMIICHQDSLIARQRLDTIGEALHSATSILAQHFKNGNSTLATSTIYRFAETSAHYLVGRWPGEKPHGSRALLPILLARVVTTYYKTAPDTARAAAVTLAAAAFACDTYPGGKEPTPNDNALEKRAVSVLRHYQTHKPDQGDVMMLFLFGFFGVLPRCIVDGLDVQLAAIIPFLTQALRAVPGRPWSTPWSFSLRGHIFARLFECFSSGAYAINGELARVLADLWIVGLKDVRFHGPFGPDPGPVLVGPRTYANALVALCFAESKVRQEFFMNVINAQRIPDAPLEQLKSNDNNGILWHLCNALLNTRTTMFPVAAVHFGLLVANTISSAKDSLDDRRSALHPLLSFHDRFPGLMWPSPFVFEELVSHLEQCVTEGSTFDSLARTMQFVVDFCDADGSPNMGAGMGSAGGTVEVDWRGKLQELKRRYQPNIDAGPSIEEIGYPRPVEVPAEVTVATPGTASGAVEIWPNYDYPDDTEWCC